jgi:transcriptional regulator with XRE-family HTH domain
MSDVVHHHIAKRLRARRKLLHFTQTRLGSACGVSFQQIQKYESTQNHISAVMLWRLAGALGVGVQYFYDGLALDGTQDAAIPKTARTGLSNGSGAGRQAQPESPAHL